MQEIKQANKKEEQKEEVKQEEIEYALVKYPTEHMDVIQTPDGTLLTTNQALVVLLNEVAKIRKSVG
jgi:hypothetical protein